MRVLLLVSLVALGMVSHAAAQARPPYARVSDCGPCDYSQCTTPQNCEAGVTTDRCACCNVCAKKEFEKCDHPSVPSMEYLGR